MQNQSESSNLRNKRQSFQKQIRSRFMNEYFATQRKLLFQSQLSRVTFLTPEQAQMIGSIEQLQAHLNKAFVPNYQAVNIYLKQHHVLSLPYQIQQLLIQKSLTPQFLKNQDALVALVTLWNLKQFDSLLITEQRTGAWICGIIQHNLVLEDPHHLIYRVDYFTTVCWVLFALATMVKDKQHFLPIKKHLHVLQSQAHNCEFQFIALLSQLSTSPQLLPSETFIQSLLHNTHSHSRNQKLMIFVVNLLDNYLRYNTQQLHRFQKQENLYLAIDYMRFILARVKEVNFPNHLKIELVKLMTTLVRSSSTDVLVKIFEQKESLQLCVQLLYRAEFDEWEGKLASLQCFGQMLCQTELLPRMTEFIGAQTIAHLCQNSLSLPDKVIQLQMLACINFLLLSMPKTYKNLFNERKFLMQIRQLQLSQQRNNQDQGEQYSLAKFAQTIFEIHLENEQK